MTGQRLLLGTRQGIVALHLTDDGWSRGSVLWRNKPVSALAVDPGHPDRIHAAVCDDGVYRSEDGGRTWERYLWAELHVLAVQPDGAVVFAGGEPAAVYRSTDRGSYWEPARITKGLARPATDQGAWRRVRSVVFDPADPSVAYAAVEGGGVLVTFDAGGEWSMLAARGLPGSVQALHVRGQEPSELVAGTNDGVFRSADQGFFWTRLGAGLEGSYVLTLGEFGDALLAAVLEEPLRDWWDRTPARLFRLPAGAARWWPATEPLDGAVYAFARAAGGVLFCGTTGGSLLRSVDAGAVWDVVASGLPPIRALAVV